MKKMNLFLVAALLFCTSPLLAQFGAQAGALFTTLKFEGDDGDGGTITEKFDTRTGFNAGLFYRKQLGGILALQPELNWMQKGGKQSESLLDQNYEIEITLNYLELPVYLLYTGGNTSGFFAGIGPAFNFAMSGKYKTSFGSESGEEDINFGSDEGDDIKGFYMAINGMAGYQLQNGININAFVTQSITNSAPDDGDDTKASLFGFGVRVGYMFGGGGEARNSKVRVKQIL
jgi:hypothetical protein